VPKNTDRHPLKSKVETLDTARLTTPDLLPPPGTFDRSTVATVTENGTVREIKEWQAIMDHLRGLPVRNAGELPVIPVDARAASRQVERVPKHPDYQVRQAHCQARSHGTSMLTTFRKAMIG
jgi:5'-nucleotidase/UDP-sugar diphosphatase